MTTALQEPPRAGRRSPSRWGLSLPQLWAFVAVALPLMVVQGQLGAIDLAYHLRLGEAMLRTHSVVRSDTLTYTAAGLPWLDQQWAAQVVLAVGFRALGWAGMALLRGLLVGVAFLFVYLAGRAAGAPPRRASLLALGSFAVAFFSLPLRPQLLGAVLFSATLWLAFNRHAHPAWVWGAVPLAAVWANVHGTFFLAPLVLGLAWLEDRAERRPSANRLLRTALATAAATLLNPFGPRVWTYALSISTNPQIARLITEWQPPTIRDPAGALFLASVATVAAALARRGRPVPWPSLAWLGAFLVVGLTAVRGVLWWALVLPPVLARVYRDQPPRPGPEMAPTPLNTLIAATVVVLAASLFPWSLVGRPALAPGRHVADAPEGITLELRRILGPGDRVFNPQPWGSWMEFALPANPVFIDSRIELFPEPVWQDLGDVYAGREGWQGILDRWRVDAVVVSRERHPRFAPVIGRDPGWRLAYRDADGFVFVRG